MSTIRWLGAAADITDVWTITVGGTWATSDTVTVTINGKDVTGIVGSTTTVAEVCSLIANMLANSLSSLGTGESYSPSSGGQGIQEFKEYTYAAGSTTVVCTSTTAGVPGTISVSKSSTSGTVSISNTTAATGKKFLDNADNWSGGSAPANSDTLVFDSGSTDCLYGINTSLTGLTINILEGYSGKIGLPEVNGSGTTAYNEYRTKYLTTAGGTTTVLIDDSKIQRVRLAFGANTANIVVRNTGTRVDQNVPVVLLTGGNASSTLAMTKGDVGAAFYAGETAQLSTLKTGFVSSQTSDVKFYGGTGLTMGAVTKNGGTLTFNNTITSLTHQPKCGPTTINGSGTLATATIHGGTLNWNSTGALAGTSCRVGFDGLLSFDQDPQAKTVSNDIAIYGASAKLSDRNNVIASLGFNLYEGALLGNVTLGPNLNFAVTAAP